MRKYLLAAAAAAAIATPAVARDGSGYFGVEGGVLFPKDTGNVDFSGTYVSSEGSTYDIDGSFETDHKRGYDIDLIAGYDLVLDGTDDFATRFAVSDACVAMGKTLVSGAIARWTGQVGVFSGKPCYRCLVPEIPPDAETCVSVGVVGALGGVIGSMMALEAVKLIAASLPSIKVAAPPCREK